MSAAASLRPPSSGRIRGGISKMTQKRKCAYAFVLLLGFASSLHAQPICTWYAQDQRGDDPIGQSRPDAACRIHVDPTHPTWTQLDHFQYSAPNALNGTCWMRDKQSPSTPPAALFISKVKIPHCWYRSGQPDLTCYGSAGDAATAGALRQFGPSTTANPGYQWSVFQSSTISPTQQWWGVKWTQNAGGFTSPGVPCCPWYTVDQSWVVTYAPQNGYSESCPDIGPCPIYPENKTTGCNKATADLYATMPQPTSLTYIFHQMQTCIAEGSCKARCTMDNCKWLEAVMPEFVGHYLQSDRQWPTVTYQCDLYKMIGLPLPRLACAARMAEYHISVDLADALTKYGCGSQADWDAVFKQIGTCPLAVGQPNAVPAPDLLIAGTFQAVVKQTVSLMRNQARQQCLTRRAAVGAYQDVEPSLRGQKCGG